MWNKGIRTFIIIEIKSSGFKLKLPIPLFVFIEILDGVTDMLALTRMIIPNIKVKVNDNQYQYKNVSRIMEGILSIVNTLKYSEKFELVHVETKNEKVVIKII